MSAPSLAELKQAMDALRSSPNTGSYGTLNAGLAEALLLVIASGGQIQAGQGLTPGFTGFGKIGLEAQYRLPTKSRLVGFLCQQFSGQSLYLQIHNAVDAIEPIAVDAIPVEGFSIHIANGGTGGLTLADHGPNGRSFGDNPVICFSTVQSRFVAAASSSLQTVMLTGQVVS